MFDNLQALLDTTAGTRTIGDFLFHLGVAFLLAQLVAWVYVWTHRGMSYSRSQAQSLIMLAVIVTTVMLAVGNNLAGAFGVFGALAMIRFRTPIKDTRDTSFLFLAVAVGVAIGTGNVSLAVVGTLFALAVALYLAWARFGDADRPDGLLRFRIHDAADPTPALDAILTDHCSSFSLLHLRDSGSGTERDVAYRLRLFAPDRTDALLADVRGIAGIGAVSLLMQHHDEEP